LAREVAVEPVERGAVPFLVDTHREEVGADKRERVRAGGLEPPTVEARAVAPLDERLGGVRDRETGSEQTEIVGDGETGGGPRNQRRAVAKGLPDRVRQVVAVGNVGSEQALRLSPDGVKSVEKFGESLAPVLAFSVVGGVCVAGLEAVDAVFEFRQLVFEAVDSFLGALPLGDGVGAALCLGVAFLREVVVLFLQLLDTLFECRAPEEVVEHIPRGGRDGLKSSHRGRSDPGRSTGEVEQLGGAVGFRQQGFGECRRVLHCLVEDIFGDSEMARAHFHHERAVCPLDSLAVGVQLSVDTLVLCTAHRRRLVR
jgi:hypothetical protein